jgi:hypothetical protein
MFHVVLIENTCKTNYRSISALFFNNYAVMNIEHIHMFLLLGVSLLPYWRTPWANKINGTDGSWIPPVFNTDFESQRVYLYSTQICRSVYAKFEIHSSVLDIPTERFSIPGEVFANSTINPDNAGFGTADSGVLDVSACNKGAPIFISLPHLLYAADRYKNQVDGINPDPAVHRTVLDIEPHTGLVISAQKRLQINVFLEPDGFIRDLAHISEVILPTIWINESTTIDQKSAHDLNNQVLRFFIIAKWVSVLLIGIGIVAFILTIVLYKRRRASTKPGALLNGSHRDTLASHDNDEDSN